MSLVSLDIRLSKKGLAPLPTPAYRRPCEFIGPSAGPPFGFCSCKIFMSEPNKGNTTKEFSL